MLVFLSGGLRSNWQDKVIMACPTMGFCDPRQHGLESAALYTPWNLLGVRNSQIVFAYMEQGNPSGFGLAAEAAYGKALGKTIILVDEKSESDEQFARHFAMIGAMADIRLTNLDAGIVVLQSFA